MKKKFKLLTIFLVSMLSLLFIFVFVNPEGRPLIFIFVPVLLMWVMLFSGSKFLLELILNKTSKIHSLITFILTSFLVLLFLLSGIGQLTIRDLILVLSLGIVCGFYFYRTWV